ncbi:NUDIX domain-containing protein [Halobacillus fulvus]|nr:NUDIX domain-containing protein [Halobacillus fulvus]
MIYQRLTYRIDPNQYESFTRFFHEYILPNRLGHGARLVDRYATLARDEIMTIWEYDSLEAHDEIDKKLKQSDLFLKAEKRKKELPPLYIDQKEDFMETTGEYHFPKHIVSVSACVTNKKGEVLFVNNEHRSDTYEMPGGRMEHQETLEQAVKREVLEETGVHMKVTGVTGVYQNLTIGVVCIVFKGEYVSGELAVQPGETKDVGFIDVSEGKLDELVTREHFRIRVEDALKREGVSVESYFVRPYDVVYRLEK